MVLKSNAKIDCHNILLWNQGLFNIDFDDNKIMFKTNDSSVIRQDDFQSGNYKDKSS